MTKIAHPEREHEQDLDVAERLDDEVTRATRATAKAGADVARESVELAQSSTEVLVQDATDVAEDAYGTARQLAEKSPEVGRAFAELIAEQSRQSVDTLSAFARAVNWTDVAQAQSQLIAGSFVRISKFNARYGQFLLRGMTASAASSRQ
jgi:hypothetical protein